MKRPIVCLALILICLRVLANAQTLNTQAVVDQFYPQRYVDEAARLGEQLDRVNCYAVYQSLASGEPQLIIAAYPDFGFGAVRVLARQAPGSYTVAFEPSGLDLGGTACGIELVDVDGDGISEIHIAFGSFSANSADWVFKWDGSKLIPIGPMVERRGVLYPLSINGGFMDFYHDGTLQLVSGGDFISVYRLVNGKFVLDSPVEMVENYVRQKGEPRTEYSYFTLAQGSTGPYTLMVINGDKDGSGRVSSATISVNGTQVVAPYQFNQQVESINVPLTALTPQQYPVCADVACVMVAVQLDGKPGSHIQVLVKDQTPQFLNQ
ncbi:MAG: hypothetical protein ACE14M_04160 [Terriglobales bacterium]